MSPWLSCKRWLGTRATARRPLRSARPALEQLEDRCVPAISITQFTNGINPGSSPYSIVAGRDGNLWFTEFNGGAHGDGAIGRITPTGLVTEFTDGIFANAGPEGITAGPDNNLWFTEYGASQIGRITPSGSIFEYSAGITANSHPLSITLGPDGNLWFTEVNGGVNGDGAIGRIAPDGEVTEFSAGLPAGSAPADITVGPDGNLWFTESGTSEIGEITTAGTITNFSDGISPNSGLRGITAGADGSLWFIEGTGNRIGRITTTGTVTEYSAGLSPSANLNCITAGPDGALWFTEGDANNIGRITTAGTITESRISQSLSTGPMGITTGPDGNLWFAEFNAGAIGRVSGVQAVTTTALSSSDTNAGYGEMLVLTATLNTPLGNLNANVTGVVLFYDGSELIGAAAVSGNLAVMTTDALSAGTHDLTARYTGTDRFAASTSNDVEEAVGAAGAFTAVYATGVPSTYGQVVAFTATVTAVDSDATPTGAVSFFDNGRLLGTASLSGGVAVFTTAALSGGDHPDITAQYLPTSNFYALDVPELPADQLVSPASTSITLTTANLGLPYYGQPIVLTATVAANNTPATPTGLVQFYDGMTLLGTSAVSGGIAAVTTATLTAGYHTNLKAVYVPSPTADFWGTSTLAPVALQISPALTSIMLGTSDNFVPVGQLVTYTATVTDFSSPATPTGYVTFYDNGNVIGASTLSGGSAAIAVAPTNSGAHAITAAYTPADGNFIGTSTIVPMTESFTPGPAAELLFGQQPAFSFVNVALPTPVTVFVADVYGNLVSTSNAKVAMALGSNPGAATLSGTRTVTAVNGVATFDNLKLNRKGSGYTLAATSTALQRGISSDFIISSVTHFTITVSTKKVQAGEPFNITIKAVDGAGHVDPNYRGTVQIVSTDPSLNVVIGSYTFTADDAGQHTFTGLIFTMPPQVTITVQDTQRPLIRGTHTVTVSAPPGMLVMHVAKLTAQGPAKLL